MELDPLSLVIPGIFATAIAGLLVFGSWLVMHRDQPALLWWSGAKGANALGLSLMTAGMVSEQPVLYSAGIGVSTSAPALLWGGVRRFHGRPLMPYLVLGMAAWLAAEIATRNSDYHALPVYVFFVAWIGYMVAAAWSLARRQEEKLPARWPLAAAFLVHGLVFVGAIHDLANGVIGPGTPPPVLSWFGIIHFETILFAMATAVFMLMMCKSRVVHRYRRAAQTDTLTGALTRGTFFSRAGRLLDRANRDGQPFSVVMFDLDHFKKINDEYGHAVGDRLLADFADTVHTWLRPNDLFGRYGGEEFSVALPDAPIETARAIAERIRRAFAESHEYFDGHHVRATVSVGVAQAGRETGLDSLLDAADQAMYAAKHSGRNRVECAPDPVSRSSDQVVRIA